MVYSVQLFVKLKSVYISVLKCQSMT